MFIASIKKKVKRFLKKLFFCCVDKGRGLCMPNKAYTEEVRQLWGTGVGEEGDCNDQYTHMQPTPQCSQTSSQAPQTKLRDRKSSGIVLTMHR